MATRAPAVAGTWYPATPRTLAKDVNEYLRAAAPTGTVDGQITALIAPHAGLMFSGPVGAHAYATVAGRRVDVVVLVGPSHFVAFDGVALYPDGAFATPLGEVPIDAGGARSLERFPVIHAMPSVHVREHSLEMQLPFLKRVLPDAAIVPLVMGHQRRETAYLLGDAIAAAVKGRRAILIASTDLSHYQNAATAATLDSRVIGQVQRFDPDGLMSLLEAFPEHACGGGPTVAVMHAAKLLGATDARVLKYGDSGDVSGDKDAVVGYLAAAFGAFTPMAQ
jgi:MEMO1 family protein